MRITDGRHHFYQWDLNQRVAADGLAVGDEVHFTNVQHPTALVVKAYAREDGLIVVDVPNVLLRDAYPLIAYRYLKRGDSESTRDEKTWQVKKRPQPSDYVYEETEVQDIMALTEGMREAVAQIGQFTTEQDGRVAELHKADAVLRAALESRMDTADAAIRTELSGKAGAPEVAELAERVGALEQNGGGGGGGGAVSVNITDSTAAHVKTVPKNALPVAAITEIGGASEHIDTPLNLAALKAKADQEYTGGDEYNSSCARIQDDGTIVIDPDYYYGFNVEFPITLRDLFPSAVIGREYTLTCEVNHDAYYGSYGAGGGNVTLAGMGYLSSFILTDDLANLNIVISPSVYQEVTWNDPETGEEWYEDRYCTTYISGIELAPVGRENGKTYDAKVTSVETAGVNLLKCNPKELVEGGVTVTIDERGVITLNGTCTNDYAFFFPGSVKLPMGKWYILRDFAEGVFPDNSSTRIEVAGVYSGYSGVYIANNGDLSKAMAKFTVGTPEDLRFIVRLKKGHTYENCKLYPMLVEGLTEPKAFAPYATTSYPIPEAVQALPAYGLASTSSPELYNRIIFRDGRAIYEQRVTASRSPLSPYAETDITDILGWDGFIDVEGGGTITFANQYSDPVPSTVIYQQD